MAARITINTTTTSSTAGSGDLPAAVNTVVADYIDDVGNLRGLTRGQIVETCLTGISHDEVNQWVSDGDLTLELAAAYHQLLNAIREDHHALDRAVFGAAVIRTGQPVQWRATFTTPDKLRGLWYAGGVWHGVILDAELDPNGDVLVGWGGVIRWGGARRHRYQTRMSPDQLLSPDQQQPS